MFVVLWLLIGIASVSISFFLAASPGDLWQSVNAAGLTAAVYLLGLLIFTLRKPFSFSTRIISWLVAITVCVSLAFAWRTQDEQCHWQQRQLRVILQRISSGILHAQIYDTLLLQFQQYHSQEPTLRKPIGRLFYDAHPGISEGSNFYHPPEDWDSTRIYLHTLTDSSIVVIGRYTYTKGLNPVFENYDNRKGKFQVRATLTEKGIEYVREN
ncbi:MAG: hypothetical protein HYZ34_12440 [Ignavibacteriae bacterium]|nr:hypothetical protein [Ignavibacteriota bacterium]